MKFVKQNLFLCLCSGMLFLLFLTSQNSMNAPYLNQRIASAAPDLGFLNAFSCKVTASLTHKNCFSENISAGVQSKIPVTELDGCQCQAEERTLASKWNNCLDCLFQTFLGTHKKLEEQFSEFVDPDSNIETRFSINGQSMNLLSGASTLAGYERIARITDAKGAICMNLNYTRNKKDIDQVKAIVHVNTKYCPQKAMNASYAIAMNFDIFHTDPNFSTASFFQTGEFEGNDYNFRGKQADSVFYMKVDKKKMGEKIRTKGWAYKLVNNKALKYYIDGQRGDLVYVASAEKLPLKDASLSSKGLKKQCVHDTQEEIAPMKKCTQAGFGFRQFPLSIRSIANSTQYPSWTIENLAVSPQTPIEQYFK